MRDVTRANPRSDDLARAIFEAADDQESGVPAVQTTWVFKEVARIADDRPIIGFAQAMVDGSARYVFSIIDDQAYLLRWAIDDLEVTFLGQLPGLRYREFTHGLGSMHGFEGEPVLAIELEHDRLPGVVRFEAKDWQVGLIAEVRTRLRGFASKT